MVENVSEQFTFPQFSSRKSLAKNYS